MSCLSLVAGHWSELTGARRRPGALKAPDTLVWVAGEAPTDDELGLVTAWLSAEGLTQDAIDRLLDHPRAHLEHGERAVALVLDSLAIDEDGDLVSSGHIVCVLAPHTIVTVSLQPTGIMDEVVREVRRTTRSHGREAMGLVLSTLVTQVLGAAEDVEAALSASINDIEQEMFNQRLSDPVERIYTLKRQVSKADYTIGALARPLERLADGEQLPFANRATTARLRRLSEWTRRLGQLLEADDRMLGDMLQVHLAQVSVRQNEDMRKISAWAGLVAVPTLISGVYGMNFTHIPWLAEPWGFGVVMGAMAAVCVVLYRVFKRSGWL